MYQPSDEILSFYRQTQESKRLKNDVRGQIEFTRTQEIITRYLPAPPAVVLDIGGGSGPYACCLAKVGYEVHLVDPVDLHIEQAKEASNQQPEHPIASISLGDARELRFSSTSADAVLLLGPLYHLIGDRPPNEFGGNLRKLMRKRLWNSESDWLIQRSSFQQSC